MYSSGIGLFLCLVFICSHALVLPDGKQMIPGPIDLEHPNYKPNRDGQPLTKSEAVRSLVYDNQHNSASLNDLSLVNLGHGVDMDDEYSVPVINFAAKTASSTSLAPSAASTSTTATTSAPTNSPSAENKSTTETTAKATTVQTASNTKTTVANGITDKPVVTKESGKDNDKKEDNDDDHNDDDDDDDDNDGEDEHKVDENPSILAPTGFSGHGAVATQPRMIVQQPVQIPIPQVTVPQVAPRMVMPQVQPIPQVAPRMIVPQVQPIPQVAPRMIVPQVQPIPQVAPRMLVPQVQPQPMVMPRMVVPQVQPQVVVQPRMSGGYKG